MECWSKTPGDSFTPLSASGWAGQCADVRTLKGFGCRSGLCSVLGSVEFFSSYLIADLAFTLFFFLLLLFFLRGFFRCNSALKIERETWIEGSPSRFVISSKSEPISDTTCCAFNYKTNKHIQPTRTRILRYPQVTRIIILPIIPLNLSFSFLFLSNNINRHTHIKPSRPGPNIRCKPKKALNHKT